MPSHPPRIALVGDRSPAVRAHQRIPAVLDALDRREHLPLDAYWVPTPDAADDGALLGFDAVWLMPGSPYRSEDGAVRAVRTARERGIPFLGTCAGFQHALLEFARNVAGRPDLQHQENTPDAADALIMPLACSLAGHESTVLHAAGSLARQVIGADRSTERYLCSYGLNPAYLDLLVGHGLRVSGVDTDGQPRVIELPGHPFFLATLFQPELAPDADQPHPIIRALATATHAVAATAV
jgi:CTP synthase (UTP-ammonia lyase)